MTKEELKNLSALRQELMIAYIDFKEGRISIKDIREKNRIARNIIDTCKVQIAYEYVKNGSNRIKYIEESYDD